MIAIGVATYGGMLLLLREEMLIAECKNIVQKIRRR
jgi:hypothetical protein